MARVTGIGGVFMKAKTDEKALEEWYVKHLGMPLEPWGGVVLRWKEDTAEDGGATVWQTAEPASEWFSPSGAPFMIDYRVDDMAGIVEQLCARRSAPSPPHACRRRRARPRIDAG